MVDGYHNDRPAEGGTSSRPTGSFHSLSPQYKEIIDTLNDDDGRDPNLLPSNP